MCGIAGFFNPKQDYIKEEPKWRSILNHMNQAQKHRGPDGSGTYLAPSCGLAHVRLKIIDLLTGAQPMVKKKEGFEAAIVFNGEIYNMNELKAELKADGASFETSSDTEVILNGYLLYGKEFIKKLNGIFAAAIWDSSSQKLLLFRDRLGVKPLFYTKQNDTFLFASEIKGLFSYPGVEAVLDHDGLCEIFALGPAKSYGKGVFKDIYEVLPGCLITLDCFSSTEEAYWKLESRPHLDSPKATIEKTAWLLEDAIKLQMLSDIPISTFLSGGIDSSLVTAICAKHLKEQGKQLNTFSFDFTGNHHYFKPNDFQPSEDRPFVEQMIKHCRTSHRFLECGNAEQLKCLYSAVDARDLPCMADVESSMLYFCSQVVLHNKVALTGECADEIFGGYPWFHSKTAFETDAFPWSSDMAPRQSLLDETILHDLHMEEYARAAYEKTIQETPHLPGESKEEQRRRQIAFLNLKWFMATLLDRMDRTSMFHGLEARVPFADHRIVEYIFNVPWQLKCPNGIVKGLLRQAAANFLPSDILWRKKSPYPKTYDPSYEKLLGTQLQEVLSQPSSPIRSLLDPKKVQAFLNSPSDYGRPWYGQLMAGPQMLAYMLQVNYWLKTYHIRIV